MMHPSGVELVADGLGAALWPIAVAVVLAVLAGGATAWLGERLGLRDSAGPMLVRSAVVGFALWFGWEAITAAWLPWSRACWGEHISPATASASSSRGASNGSP